MREILFEYEMHPTTWVYVSSLLIIGIYFKFNRVWSIRNLDLIGLIFYAPGLLMVTRDLEQWGYVWLFAMNGFFLVRLLLDPLMVRRPLLEPNLSAGGLTFTGIALLVFLLTNVVTVKTSEMDLEGAVRWEHTMARRAARAEDGTLSQYGPGYPLFYAFADLANRALVSAGDEQAEGVRRQLVREATTRTTAILGHFAVVLGIALIGYRHFDNIHTGVAAASLYLLLPYTSQFIGRVDHVVPAALLVWAVAAYRRPMVAGILLGLATGVIYYPIFLLPLWCSFYWQRGLLRFVLGVATSLVLLTASLAFTSTDFASFLAQLKQMTGWTSLSAQGAEGFWEQRQAYRIPVLAAFIALAGSMAIWPAQKHLGSLISCSAAVMLATQFWHTHQGGIYMAWYLPLLVLTVFRPNLEDRVALTAVDDSWLHGLNRLWLRLRRLVRPSKRSASAGTR
jgi:hypothetical protein